MLTLAIQAGGGSARMGRDKALMPFLGLPLICRIIKRLQTVADEILVTTNCPEDYGFLGLPLYSDLRPGHGALGGLYTALDAAANPSVAVVACDMPFANPDLLRAEMNLLDELGVDIVIPTSTRGLEPLHAIYRKETCLPAVEAALDAGMWKVISFFPEVTVHYLDIKETASYDTHGLAFWNLNTLEEFLEAERQAGELSI